MRSSLSSKSVSREKERTIKEKILPQAHFRNRIRRGSSLSDLDKLHAKIPLPDVVRSTEKCCSGSLTHSPAFSRTNLELASSHVRGSIGDLMNLKKYGGSNWSVRSETMIAKVVPLSTVTPKQSPPLEKDLEEICRDIEDYQVSQVDLGSCGPLTCAERTQRLSRLIKKHRRNKVFGPSMVFKDNVSFASIWTIDLCHFQYF